MKLIECPRDAMQGWKHFIATEQKIEYINALLKVGFDTLDFGSFVSPKAIPQLADTREVIQGLDLDNTSTRLMAIIANLRGAEEASGYEQISFLGFPFSVSETFQQRNTNSSVSESFKRVAAIAELCKKSNKEPVIYISMGFGNPYGDAWSPELVFDWVDKLVGLGIHTISLADTVGVATAQQVSAVTGHLVRALPGVEIGVHLHSTPYNWKAKLEAAYQAGSRRFDGALKGIGGCPMAGDELVGNMNTEWMIDYFGEQQEALHLDKAALEKSLLLAGNIFK